MNRLGSIIALAVLTLGMGAGARALTANRELPAVDNGGMLLFLPQITDARKYAICKNSCDTRETSCLKAAKDTEGIGKCKKDFSRCMSNCNLLDSRKPVTH